MRAVSVAVAAAAALELVGCSNAVSPAIDAHRSLMPETMCVREFHAQDQHFAKTVFGADGACVLYDPSAMRLVARRYGYSAAVGVFGHEFGHVLCMARRLDETQECADAWAGCALVREGYEPFEYLRLINDVDVAHYETRHAATWRGWNRCQGSHAMALGLVEEEEP